MSVPSPTLRRSGWPTLTVIHHTALTRTRVAWLAIGVGAVVRVAQYLSGRSLWLDEAMLSLNILQRSWAGLLQPLDYHQGAPIGYLMLAKAATMVFGTSEWALRLVPLLAALAALPLFYWLAQEALQPNAAVLALALFAIVNPLVDFASEAKQYSSDVLVAIVLLLAATRVLRLERAKLRHGLGLGLLGAAALWFSHPAVFVLAGIGLVLLWRATRRKAWDQPGALVVIGGLWAGSFGVEYLILLRYLSHDQALLQYWASGFMPLPPLDVSWFIDAFVNLFQYSTGLMVAGIGIGALAFLDGVVTLWPERRAALALLLAPLGVTLLASAAHVYPFSERLLLFAAPCVLILVGAGIGHLWGLLRPAPVARFLLVGLLFLNPLYQTSYDLMHPRTKEEARPVLNYVRGHWQTGDVIFMPNASQFAYAYYAPRLGLDSQPALVGTDSNNWQTLLSEVDQQRGQARVWFVCLHIQKPDQTVLVYLSYLDHIGVRLDAYHAPGSAVYLYDLTPRAP